MANAECQRTQEREGRHTATIVRWNTVENFRTALPLRNNGDIIVLYYHAIYCKLFLWTFCRGWAQGSSLSACSPVPIISPTACHRQSVSAPPTHTYIPLPPLRPLTSSSSPSHPARVSRVITLQNCRAPLHTSLRGFT